MDFKLLIKKFDSKKNEQDSKRLSTKELLINNKNNENKNILGDLNNPNSCGNNENHRNTIASLSNINSRKDNDKFLSKINMFEQKGKNKENNFTLDRCSLKSPFMSDLDNVRKYSKEINNPSNIKNDETKEKNDEKEELKNVNIEKKNDKNEKLKQNNKNIENIENNNINNKDKKGNIKENLINEGNNNKININKNIENDIKKQKLENPNEKIKNNEVKENNKNINNINIKNKINENGKDNKNEKEIIEKENKKQDLNIDNESKNKNKEQINIDLYSNISESNDEEEEEEEEEDDDEDEEPKKQEKEKGEKKNEKIKEKELEEKNNKNNIENEKRKNKEENNKVNKIINNKIEKNEEQKKENIINIKEENINNDKNNIQDNFDENLDITKLIKSKENLNIDNNNNDENNDDEIGNIDNYGFEKTISNIEIINQNPSLYVEDEMNETLINISKPKKEKEKKIINNSNKEKNINIYEEKEEINKNNNITNLNNIRSSEYTKKMKDLFDYDEEENLIKTFNSEDFSIRRYDSNTIDSGKKFFKFRFIKNKVENFLKISRITTINTSINNKLFTDKSLSTSTIGLSRSNNSIIKKNYSFKNDFSISNMNSYDKEKEIRVYSSEFLKLVEKAIFSFNLKKYKESYGYLLKSGIIYNPEEYGEFLLVTSGFDKNIIGEFLSKNHPPNEKKEVLNSFTSCIDVEYPTKKLLDCARFLFSKVNLPKDANLILEIINSFSLHYFNENKGNEDFLKIFKTSNNIYLLLSTILAVNTMFIRTDIKNVNVITKEEFIKMNKDISSNVVENIYLELKNEPISMIDDDYNQNIYKKLSSLVIEKTKTEINNINDYENNKIIIEENINEDDENINMDNYEDDDDKQRKMTFSLSQNFQSFTKGDKEILSKPTKFLKFSGKNSSHYRQFLVYDNFTKLIWAKSIDPNKIKGNIHFIMISDIIDVFNGINHSETIQKYFNSKKEKEKEKNNFITIISSTRQIDLKANDLQSALSWFKALKSLVLKVKSKEEKKIEKQIYLNNEKLKNKIEMIWKNSILPKWGEYGDYLLYKIHEKKNDLYNLKLIDKNNNINNQINDDKLSASKKIELIMKETENKKILSESDFYTLYNLGLPFFVRRKIWKFLIGNPCNISKILYDAYVSQVETVNFDTIDIKYHEDVNEVFSCDYIINQMIVDIIKIKDLFLCELITRKLEQNVVMLEAYKIIRTFFMIRNDLNYNKNIIPLIFIFLILGENEFNTFSNIYNLICGTNTIKYLLGDEQFVKRSVLFFNELIQKKVPRVFEHFKKLEITTELYLIPWFEEIFTGTLSYKILLRVLDLYLLNGDYILYQVGLNIIKIQEEDILNSTISEVFKVLRRLPSKYKEDFFLEHIKEFSDLKEKYFSWNKENILGEQKQLLYQDFYEEEG